MAQNPDPLPEPTPPPGPQPPPTLVTESPPPTLAPGAAKPPPTLGPAAPRDPPPTLAPTRPSPGASAPRPGSEGIPRYGSGPNDQTLPPPARFERGPAGARHAADAGMPRYGSGPNDQTLPPTTFGRGSGLLTGPSTTLPAHPPGEQRQIGPYLVVEEIGRGGMGVVYRARQPGLNRDIALKVMIAGEHAGEEAFDRFVREARAAGSLRHPGIVGVHDVGLHEGLPYIVMDYVQGKSLADALQEESFPVQRAVEIVRQLAEALQHAHENGIIHRDIKPGNILLGPDGKPALTDFGLAREMAGPKGLTQSGAALGTPAYMSPEQAKGTVVDARTDIYGIGAVCYEILTGRPPFEGENPYQILARVMRDEPAPMAKYAANVPRDVELICQTAMAKEPGRRYQTARAMAEDCDRFLRGEAIAARAPSMWYQVRRRARRHRAVLLAVSASLLASAVGAYGFVIHPRLLEAAEDRAALQRALAAKRELEAGFTAELGRGALDDAIEHYRQHFGIVPPLPELRDRRRADAAAFDDLRTAYRVDLPGAYLARARQRMAALDARARGDLANAFRVGRDVPEHRGTARTALAILLRELVGQNDLEAADYTGGLILQHFGGEHPSVKAALALLHQRRGRLETAAALWHQVEADPDHRDEARAQLEVLRLVLPEGTFANPGDGFALEDLDKDGVPEAVKLEAPWTVHVLRLVEGAWVDWKLFQAWREPTLPASGLQVLDADLDGEPEFVLTGYDGKLQEGRVIVVEWHKGTPAVGGELTVPVALGGFTAGDLDGDGVAELVCRQSRALAMLHYGPDGLRSGATWPLGCEVHALQFWHRQDLVIWFGPWIIASGWPLAWRLDDPNLFVCPPDRDPVPHGPGVMPRGEIPWGYRIGILRHMGDGWCRIATEVPGRYADGWCHYLDDESLILAVSAEPTTLKVLPELKRGIFRVRHRDGVFGLPEPFGDAGHNQRVGVGGFWREEIGGRPHAVTHTRELLRCVPLDGGPERFAGVPGGFGLLQLDADPPRELYWRKSGQPLRVSGLGAYVPPAPSAADLPLPAVSTEGVLSPEQELLEARLYDEAIQTCRERLKTRDDARTWYHLGLALSAQQEWTDAADAFQHAARHTDLVVDALLRRAHALESLRDWAKLAECLELLAKTRRADPFARDAATRALGSARQAAALAPRVAWTAFDGSQALLCENPFKAAYVDRRLVMYSSGDCEADGVGRLIEYDGGALRMSFRVKPGAMQWGVTASLGIQSASALDDRGTGYPGAILEFRCYAHGATDRPVQEWVFGYRARDGRGAAAGLGDDGWVPKPEEEYAVVMDYVPGLHQAWCQVFDAKGKAATKPLTFTLPVALERGTYFVGRRASHRGGATDANYVSDITLLEFTAQGSTGLKEANFIPETARGWLALGNGALVGRKFDAADEAYARAAAMLAGSDGDDPRVRANLHLFRALLRLRQGRAPEAREECQAATKASADEVKRLLADRGPAALSPDEIVFLRGATEAR